MSVHHALLNDFTYTYLYVKKIECLSLYDSFMCKVSDIEKLYLITVKSIRLYLTH